MMQSPVFTDNCTVEEFNNYYWYKIELQVICRQYTLSADGTKAKLGHVENFISKIEECELCRKTIG